MKTNLANDYFQILSNIGRGYQHRRSEVCCRYTIPSSKLLEFLVQYGFIRSFRPLTNFAVIYLKQMRPGQASRPPLFYFQRFNKAPNKRYRAVSYRNLLRMHRHDSGAALYLLNTDRGLLTSTEAVNQGVGGYLLFRIL